MIHPEQNFDQPAKSETIVLVPGLDGTALLFYRQISFLSEKFKVLTFPLPNHPRCTMLSMVENLYQFIGKTLHQPSHNKIFLCGESFGGALSLSFALNHPEVLKGLIIVNSFPRIRNRIALQVIPRLLKIMPWGAMRIVRQFTEWKLHSPHALPEDLAEFHERMKQVEKSGYIRRLEILRTYDIRKRLSEIKVPTLFLASELDRLVPSVKEGKFMASKLTAAQTITLKGYGHICMINHDFNLLEQIQPWVEQINTEHKRPAISLTRD
jgi:pimeloyl-ACP methyl ester carboxylesterase